MRRLSSVDAQFLAMEDGRNHAHVCQLTIIEGATANGTPLDGARLRELVRLRIDLIPPFRWRVVEVPFGLDHPVFVEDEAFDIESHIWETALPEPGSEHQLGEVVGRIASRPLDRARPLWELHFIHGLADGRVALLTKVHHAAIDGVSGLEMMSALLDPSSDPNEHHPDLRRRRTVHAKPTDAELFLRGVASLPTQPIRMVRGLLPTVRYLDQLPTMRHLPAANLISGLADRAARAFSSKGAIPIEHTHESAPKVSFGGRISAHRRFAFGSVPMDAITAIKAELPGATVNDVVVALAAGALRRRMAARGDDLSTPLIATVPVSVRLKEEKFGNQISSMLVPIPTDEPDARERITRAHDVMKAAKERHRTIPAKLLRETNDAVPPAMLPHAAKAISMATAAGLINPPFNVTISNLPGSGAPLYLAGAEIVSQHPVNLLLDGVGISLTLLSYRDRIDFGFTADRELVPDVWHLVTEMKAELGTMLEACGALEHA